MSHLYVYRTYPTYTNSVNPLQSPSEKMQDLMYGKQAKRKFEQKYKQRTNTGQSDV